MTGDAIFADLDRKRRALGMSYAALSKKSGVSLPTTKRILAGNGRPSFQHVIALAQTLGYAIKEIVPAEQLKQQQARLQARRLAGMVQATSALEAQGVDADTRAALENDAVHQLLTGSRRRLWGA